MMIINPRECVLVQLVGPILAEDAKPLPQELASFLEQGSLTGHGAIYVAMGTCARQTIHELTTIASVLSQLPNLVLWKLDPGHMPGVLSASTLHSLTGAYIMTMFSPIYLDMHNYVSVPCDAHTGITFVVSLFLLITLYALFSDTLTVLFLFT